MIGITRSVPLNHLSSGISAFACDVEHQPILNALNEASLIVPDPSPSLVEPFVYLVLNDTLSWLLRCSRDIHCLS